MSENEKVAEEVAEQEEAAETFVPKGTMFLMVMYIIVFALAWGSVYFFELLARR